MLKRHEVLFKQLEDYRRETLAAIEGLTEEMVDLVPPGFNNNIRWNLGHLYLDQYLWLQHLTKEPAPIAEGFAEWFDFGTRPADWKSQPPSLEALRTLLSEQPGRIRELYGHRLEEVYFRGGSREEFPPIESGMHTVAQVLVRTIFHEGLHLGTILAIRRSLG